MRFLGFLQCIDWALLPPPPLPGPSSGYAPKCITKIGFWIFNIWKWGDKTNIKFLEICILWICWILLLIDYRYNFIKLGTEHRTQNTDHRTQNTEHRTQNVDNITQNTEHRTQNTEHRTKNTEKRTKNTEHRTQNIDHRTQNTEQNE